MLCTLCSGPFAWINFWEPNASAADGVPPMGKINGSASLCGYNPQSKETWQRHDVSPQHFSPPLFSMQKMWDHDFLLMCIEQGAGPSVAGARCHGYKLAWFSGSCPHQHFDPLIFPMDGLHSSTKRQLVLSMRRHVPRQIASTFIIAFIHDL